MNYEEVVKKSWDSFENGEGTTGEHAAHRKGFDDGFQAACKHAEPPLYVKKENEQAVMEEGWP